IKMKYEASASTEDEFSKAKTALEKAQLSYDNALITLEDIKSKNTIATENNIEIQKAALEKQKKILNDAVIVSPIDGTVTMVNARENGTASGILFVVEDTDDLIASTAIGEYDIGLIKLGQKVIVKADGLGDKELSGTISEISPTAIKDASGNTASTSNVQFETKIALEKDSNLKIGMNVRLTIILEEKKNVYSVPYDAVINEDDGNQYIYVLDEGEDDLESRASGRLRNRLNNQVRKIQVQTGLETDMYVEIISPELENGMKILVEPSQNILASLGLACLGIKAN
ncbi:MAG: HlyD family efflux transporter periplasmic adaptor subunit, partial [Clostridiaceae bacterium]|nr:HlyD family efflux transporter periplasmic adaptor subunit [Clostridiaceae bacterium]